MQVNVRVRQIACFLSTAILFVSLDLRALEAIPVTVKPLAKVAEFPPRREPATVISLNDSRLSSEITAVITDIPVQVGQVVKAGTPLVELDRADINLAIKRNKAILNSLKARQRQAQRQLQRAQTLAQQSSLSEEELHRRETTMQISEAEIAAQQAAIAQTQRNLTKTVLRAPFKGIVMERLSHRGELAMPGTPLIRMIDIEEIQLSANLQPQHISSLKSAKNIKFVSQDRTYPVILHTVTPAVDQRERSQEVRFHFTEGVPLVGSTGYLLWRRPGPHLPADLLVRRGRDLGIFIVADKHAKFVALDKAQEGQPAPVDLPDDTAVIVDGRFLLADGDPVTVVNP
jgi:RND family efflux transporter MFP subunit